MHRSPARWRRARIARAAGLAADQRRTRDPTRHPTGRRESWAQARAITRYCPPSRNAFERRFQGTKRSEEVREEETEDLGQDAESGRGGAAARPPGGRGIRCSRSEWDSMHDHAASLGSRDCSPRTRRRPPGRALAASTPQRPADPRAECGEGAVRKDEVEAGLIDGVGQSERDRNAVGRRFGRRE